MPVPLRPGVHVPTMTFFDRATEDLDIPLIRQHAVRLARAGVAGLVTMGSNGEAVHLSDDERITVTKNTRSALDEAGFHDVHVMVGCSAMSVRGTLKLIGDAKAAGGDSVLLISPSYYRALVDRAALRSYFLEVAEQSPLPVVLYNFPGAVAGIDLDSDLMIELSQHPNIVGAKFTCGNTGKLARVTTAMGPAYFAGAGFADFFLPGLVAGANAVIAGGANVCPRACVLVYKLWTEGKLEEAREAQRKVAVGDWVLTKFAIAGTKSAIESYHGYGGVPRKPLKPLTEEEVKQVKDGIKELMEWEFSLPDAHPAA